MIETIVNPIRLTHDCRHPLCGQACRLRSFPIGHELSRPYVVVDWYDRLFNDQVIWSPSELAFAYRVRQALRARRADYDAVVISSLSEMLVVHDTDVVADPRIVLQPLQPPVTSRPHVCHIFD